MYNSGINGSQNDCNNNKLPHRVQLSIRFSPVLYNWVIEQADKRGLSFNAYVNLVFNSLRNADLSKNIIGGFTE